MKCWPLILVALSVGVVRCDQSLKSVSSVFPWDALRSQCSDNELHLAREMSKAQLDAHRCLIRDEAVLVQPPSHLIALYVHPSHVVLQRCSGLCVGRPGCECAPRKVRKVRIRTVVGISKALEKSSNNNGSQIDRHQSTSKALCTTITLEEHKGPCRCRCLTQPHHCHPNQVFDEEACGCVCNSRWQATKAACFSSVWHEWHESSCTCVCTPRRCPSAHFQDMRTCRCRSILESCPSINPRHSSISVSLLYTLLIAMALLAPLSATVIGLLVFTQRQRSKRRSWREDGERSKSDKSSRCSTQPLLDSRPSHEICTHRSLT